MEKENTWNYLNCKTLARGVLLISVSIFQKNFLCLLDYISYCRHRIHGCLGESRGDSNPLKVVSENFAFGEHASELSFLHHYCIQSSKCITKLRTTYCHYIVIKRG